MYQCFSVSDFVPKHDRMSFRQSSSYDAQYLGCAPPLNPHHGPATPSLWGSYRRARTRKRRLRCGVPSVPKTKVCEVQHRYVKCNSCSHLGLEKSVWGLLSPSAASPPPLVSLCRTQAACLGAFTRKIVAAHLNRPPRVATAPTLEIRPTCRGVRHAHFGKNEPQACRRSGRREDAAHGLGNPGAPAVRSSSRSSHPTAGSSGYTSAQYYGCVPKLHIQFAQNAMRSYAPHLQILL